MIVAGASLIIALIVCTMCIAGNVYRRASEDRNDQCSDADCRLINVLNSVHHGKVD